MLIWYAEQIDDPHACLPLVALGGKKSRERQRQWSVKNILWPVDLLDKSSYHIWYHPHPSWQSPIIADCEGWEEIAISGSRRQWWFRRSIPCQYQYHLINIIFYQVKCYQYQWSRRQWWFRREQLWIIIILIMIIIIIIIKMMI